MKPFPNRTSTFQRIRLSPDPTLLGVVRSHEERDASLVPAAPHCRLTGSAEALRPVAALPATLGGRHATGYYGLSAPVPTWGISHPTLAGVGPGSGVARVASFVRP